MSIFYEIEFAKYILPYQVLKPQSVTRSTTNCIQQNHKTVNSVTTEKGLAQPQKLD